MGHSIISCDNCSSPIMEGRNDWKCDDCGWYMDLVNYPKGTMKFAVKSNFNSFTAEQLESIKVYLEHCRKSLEECKGDSVALQNIVKELEDINEEIHERSVNR